MKSKTRGHRAEKPPRDVRDRILDAAVGILRDSGVQELTQVHVAERAGVRQSHLTYYFPTRRDLLRAVVARALEGGPYDFPEHLEFLRAAAARSVDGGPYGANWPASEGKGKGTQSEVIARVAEAVIDIEHMRLFVAMIVEADSDPALRDLITEATHRFESNLAQALGEKSSDRVRHLLIALWGLGLYQFAIRSWGKDDPTDDYVDRLKNEFGRTAQRRRNR